MHMCNELEVTTVPTMVKTACVLSNISLLLSTVVNVLKFVIIILQKTWVNRNRASSSHGINSGMFHLVGLAVVSDM